MTAPGPQPEGSRAARRRGAEESLLRGGVKGVVLVTLATAALAGAAAVIAVVISLLY
jgi:hypothetical protein